MDHLVSLNVPRNSTFLDLGTGNGELLFLLRERAGFRGWMVGVDYSAASVRLASRIADEKGLKVQEEIGFRRWDILDGTELLLEDEQGFGVGFDVVLDKGTFDAVCLNEEVDHSGTRVCERYRDRVESLVRANGGRFLVTSCNWTEEELRRWFEGGELVFEGRIDYPRFSFGGQTGQSVTSVCFRRK